MGANLYPRGDGWYQGPPQPPGAWAPAGLDLGFMTFVERMCKVPGLLGLSQEEAQALIDAYGCRPARCLPFAAVSCRRPGRRSRRLTAGSAR